jgi:MerR family transcriptional regulator, thiopeptide resistance regulator
VAILGDETSLSPAQVCKALGVSPKALKIYERRGLIRPHRTAAGWRLFGPTELARLHQIKTLKQLGLTLEEIGTLLEGQLADLGQFLEQQAIALTEQAQRIQRAHALIRRARDSLARGETLTIVDIINLNQESNIMSQADWRQLAQPIYERHMTEDDRRIPGKMIAARWDELFAEANRLFETHADARSEEALSLARRWMDLVELFTGSDFELRKKYTAAYQEALGEPDLAPHLPISREVLEYLRPAFGLVHLERGVDLGPLRKPDGRNE